MPAITDCVKTYWRNIHKQFLLRRDPEKYAKTLDAVRLCGCHQGMRICPYISLGMLNNPLQCMNTCRQAARDFCEGTGIPLSNAMAMLDTDYASEAQTCGSDTDISDSTVDRRMKAGLGQVAKKVIGFKWRSPDVSKGYNSLYLKTHLVV
jgi:hypothetical protein